MRLLLVLAALVAALATSTAASATDRRPTTLAVIGDTPYGPAQVTGFPGLVDAIDADPEADPPPGSGWAPAKRPERLRATYAKNHGVRYLFGAYDVHADRLHGRLRAHKNAGEVLGFYRQIRMRYDPRRRIYLIADNLLTHKTRRSANGPPTATSSSCSPRPPRASWTASSATSGRSRSS